MINYKYADLFKKDNVDKQFIITTDDGSVTITNKELHSEQFELNESICSDNTLRFGACEASSLRFRVANVFSSLKDKWLPVNCVLNGNSDVPFVFGKYKVNSDKPTADKRYRDIVAYDAMYDILIANVADWYNSLTFPMSLKTFRNAFISHFGLEEVEISLPNDEMTVEKTIEPSEISGKDVITAICELNACFGRIGRDGKFQYVVLKEITKGLYPSNTLYPATDLYPRAESAIRIANGKYISATYEDYVVQKIDKVQIRQEENDIGGSSGDGDNVYIIEDNFLVYGKTTEELNTIAANFLNAVGIIAYRPSNIKAIGNPCLEVGEPIKVNTKYQSIETYILNRTIKGIQGLKDTYIAKGEEYFGTNVNSVQRSIIQLKGKTNVLTRTVEETRSLISDVQSGLSTQILQNSSLIQAEATRAIGAEQELSGRIALTAESFKSQITGLNGDFTLLKQTVDGFTFEDENGKTKISGDTITTGVIKGVATLFVTTNSLFWACGVTDISSVQSSAEWICDSNALYAQYGGKRTVVIYRTGSATFAGTVEASDINIGYSMLQKISNIETQNSETWTLAESAKSTADEALEIASSASETALGNSREIYKAKQDIATNASNIALLDKQMQGALSRLDVIEAMLNIE